MARNSPFAALAVGKALQTDGEGRVGQRCIRLAQVRTSCLLQLRLRRIQEPVLGAKENKPNL